MYPCTMTDNPADIGASQPHDAALLDALAKLTGDTLSAQLTGVLEACRQSLTDLAGSTPLLTEQQFYVDALRELCLNQDRVRRDFLAGVQANFDRMGATAAKAPAAQRISADSLQLVTHEDIEQHVLAASFSAHARARTQPARTHLQERLRQLCPMLIVDNDNPLDPSLLTNTFLGACAPLGRELRVLRPLCSQFEAGLLAHLQDLYEAANQLLIDAGVLPDRSARSLGNPRTPAGDSSPTPGNASDASATGGAGSSAAIALREISELLAGLRGTGALATPSGPGSRSNGSMAVASSEGLIKLVADLQGQSTWLGSSGMELPDIRQALTSISAQLGDVRLSTPDQDTISLITLFFDTVNADRNLPLEIQSLISRLQLPILRLALQERSFFADAAHPARQLIDLMARTGLGWDAEKTDSQDTLLAELRAVVEEVLASDSNTETYRKACERVQEQAARTELRARKVERRTAERADAEARTNAAREAVYGALRARMDGTDLPAPVVDFLLQDWQRVMQLFYLRKGSDSPEWSSSVDVVDELIDSIRSPTGDRQQTSEMARQSLYATLAAGLGQTQSHTADAEARVNLIRDLHRSLLEAGHAVPALVAGIRISPPPGIPPRDAPHSDPLADGQSIGEVLMFESLQKADAIAVGTWFEYLDPRSGSSRRCKLSSRIEESRTLIFSNRSGATVWEKSRKLFAYELQISFLRPIQDSPLVDRTLDTIAETLRQTTP